MWVVMLVGVCLDVCEVFARECGLGCGLVRWGGVGVSGGLCEKIVCVSWSVDWLWVGVCQVCVWVGCVYVSVSEFFRVWKHFQPSQLPQFKSCEDSDVYCTTILLDRCQIQYLQTFQPSADSESKKSILIHSK